MCAPVGFCFQVPVVQSKPLVLAVIDELTKVEEGLKEALKESEKAEARKASQLAKAAAEQAAEEQRAHWEAVRQQDAEEASRQLEEEVERVRAELEQEKAAEVEAAAAAARAEAEEAAAVAELSPERLREVLQAPLHKLLSLFYFSHVRERCGAGREQREGGHAWTHSRGMLCAPCTLDTHCMLPHSSPSRCLHVFMCHIPLRAAAL